MTDDQEVAVTAKEIARILGVSVPTVYRKAALGELPALRVGRTWRFFPSLVREHLVRPIDPWAYTSHSRAARRRQ